MYVRQSNYFWIRIMNVSLVIVAGAVVALIATMLQAYCQMPLLECVMGGVPSTPLSAPLPTPVLQQVPGATNNQRAGSSGIQMTVQDVPQVGQPETAVNQQGVIVDLIPPTFAVPPTPIPAAAPSLYDGFSEQQREEFHAPVATPLPTATTDVAIWTANATAMSNVVSANEIRVCSGGRGASCWVVTVTPMAETGR